MYRTYYLLHLVNVKLGMIYYENPKINGIKKRHFNNRVTLWRFRHWHTELKPIPVWMDIEARRSNAAFRRRDVFKTLTNMEDMEAVNLTADFNFCCTALDRT